MAGAEAEPAEVPPEFECSICMKLLLDPVTVPCGHTFCRGCLEQSLGYRGQCAVCRAPVASGQGVNVLIRSLIAERYPQALAQRRQEAQEELQSEEQAARQARQREVAGSSGAADGATAAPILPLLASRQLFMPYCRSEFELEAAADAQLVEYALSGGRRIGVIPSDGGGYDDAARPMGVCLEIEHVERRGDAPLKVHVVGKYRFWVTEPPQVHDDGFELGRCEAFFDEALGTEQLLITPPDRPGADDTAADSTADAQPPEERATDVALEALELLERQFVHVGQAGRHAFAARNGQTPALRGNATTSAALEQLSFWLLGSLVSNDSHRRTWLAAVDTAGRLEASRTLLRTAGSRPILELPGARSWMNPGQSAFSSLALLLVIVAVLVAKAMGFFDQRRQQGGHYHGRGEEALENAFVAMNFIR
eukprot:TRINITY_DN100491_c0_g1_i1.p1 TRINITY_DN100491_c0_g1~~TRINITY_DN100491_c0_g1_i1.p1  ORF type:complete len:423 (-),score=108.18 TRINITY_DN100491_c0_g1_i1:60-1328(-)